MREYKSLRVDIHRQTVANCTRQLSAYTSGSALLIQSMVCDRPCVIEVIAAHPSICFDLSGSPERCQTSVARYGRTPNCNSDSLRVKSQIISATCRIEISTPEQMLNTLPPACSVRQSAMSADTASSM